MLVTWYAIHLGNFSIDRPINLEPDFPPQFSQALQTQLNLSPIQQAAIRDQTNRKFSLQAKLLDYPPDTIDRLRKLGSTCWLPVPRKSNVH